MVFYGKNTILPSQFVLTGPSQPLHFLPGMRKIFGCQIFQISFEILYSLTKRSSFNEIMDIFFFLFLFLSNICIYIYIRKC
jgi:hypothetical protein